MQIWAGLGNPGTQYALHRHNVGFMAVDVIADVHNFGPWSKKFRAQISEGRIGRHRVLLLKPQTFMNDSGDAVQQALRFYKLEPDALTVFHDELVIYLITHKKHFSNIMILIHSHTSKIM